MGERDSGECNGKTKPGQWLRRREQDEGLENEGRAERCALQQENGFGGDPGDSEACICLLSLEALAGVDRLKSNTLILPLRCGTLWRTKRFKSKKARHKCESGMIVIQVTTFILSGLDVWTWPNDQVGFQQVNGSNDTADHPEVFSF